MTALLAFTALPAASKLQRARCARTGRFVAWARAAALRLPGAPAVVALLPAQAVVVVVAPPAPVVVVAAQVAPPQVVVAQVEADEVTAQVVPLTSPAREGAAQAAPSPLVAVVAVVAQAVDALVAAARVALVAGQKMSAALVDTFSRRWRM